MINRQSVPIRQKDRFHGDLGSAVTHRLAVDEDALYALKTEFHPGIKTTLDFRGCNVQQQATLPTERFPYLIHSPGFMYRSLIRKPMNLVTHRFEATRDVMGDVVTRAVFRMWNEANDGAAELRMHTHSSGQKNYFLREASAAERLTEAPHLPIDEEAALNILSDVTQLNAVKPKDPPKPLATIEEACAALTQLSPATSTVRKGSYERYSGPEGSATVSIDHFERRYRDGQSQSDFNIGVKSVQPLDEAGCAFAAIRLMVHRDEVAHRPIAKVQLGVQTTPGLKIAGEGLDIARRDALFENTLDGLGKPGVFVEAIHDNLSQVMW